MKKPLLLLALILNFSLTKAQTWVTIPDANFVTYLHTIVPAAMQGDSLNTSSSLVTSSTQTIDVRKKSISNLTGIQYFTSLTYLDCSQNTISSLPPLANSIQLLWCSNNHLSVLPTLPTSLQYLFCDTNSLPSLPAFPNTLLQLSCGVNQLTALPTFPNSMQAVYCCVNNITSLPTLPNGMTYLNCTVNSLNSLPTSLPNSITVLYLGDNNLSSLPSLPNQLKYFSCDYNYITSLPTLPNSLTWFICYNNMLTNLPVLPPALNYFDCSSNNISCFPNFPASITSLNIDPNPFNCLPNYIPAMGTDTITYPLCAAGNSNGCQAVLGIKQNGDLGSQISVYPNPAINQLQIIVSDNAEVSEIKILDVVGNEVATPIIKQGKAVVDVSDLQNGIYFLNIKSGTQTTAKKIVVNH